MAYMAEETAMSSVQKNPSLICHYYSAYLAHSIEHINLFLSISNNLNKFCKNEFISTFLNFIIQTK